MRQLTRNGRILSHPGSSWLMLVFTYHFQRLPTRKNARLYHDSRQFYPWIRLENKYILNRPFSLNHPRHSANVDQRKKYHLQFSQKQNIRNRIPADNTMKSAKISLIPNTKVSGSTKNNPPCEADSERSPIETGGLTRPVATSELSASIKSV